jgi:hypothetical protein
VFEDLEIRICWQTDLFLAGSWVNLDNYRLGLIRLLSHVCLRKLFHIGNLGGVKVAPRRVRLTLLVVLIDLLWLNLCITLLLLWDRRWLNLIHLIFGLLRRLRRWILSILYLNCISKCLLSLYLIQLFLKIFNLIHKFFNLRTN